MASPLPVPRISTKLDTDTQLPPLRSRRRSEALATPRSCAADFLALMDDKATADVELHVGEDAGSPFFSPAASSVSVSPQTSSKSRGGRDRGGTQFVFPVPDTKVRVPAPVAWPSCVMYIADETACGGPWLFGERGTATLSFEACVAVMLL